MKGYEKLEQHLIHQGKVVGFYENEKKRLIGKEFIFKNDILKSSVFGTGLDLISNAPNSLETL